MTNLTLSEQTLSILSNFAKINQNIYIEPGNRLRTYSKEDGIFAGFDTEESFEQSFGIYDLKEFLSLINLHSPNLEFAEDYVNIKSAKASTRYVNRSANVLEYPKTEPKVQNFEILLSLKWDDIKEALQAASILGFEYLSLKCEDETLSLVAEDFETESTNRYEKELFYGDDGAVGKFNFIISLENIKKLYQGDYLVYLSSRKIAKFKHLDLDLEYFMTGNKNTTFGD